MDITGDIEALFADQASPEDPGGWLALLADALASHEPRLLWLTDDQGRTASAFPLSDPDAARQIADLNGLFTRNLDGNTSGVFRHDHGQTGFAVVANTPDNRAFTLGGLLSPETDNVTQLEAQLPLIRSFAAAAIHAQQSEQIASERLIQVEQLQNERDTLKNSYAQIMAGAMEEREQRLREQARYTDQLEKEVAERSADLRDALDHAKQANRTKSEFLANMSHEIRTPMTAILGYSDLLIDELADHKPGADWLQIIRRNGDHLLTIINDILDLSKIEAGKMQTEQVGFSLVELVKDVVTLMRTRTEEKGLTLSAEFSGPIPSTIQSDPTRMRQILVNLTGNAIKFTKTGSVKLVCRVANTQPDQPAQMSIDVVDSGIGLTVDQQHNLFVAFNQADTSTTRQYGGTGLGLTISRRLAQMLGGDISVTSVYGEGSTFTVTANVGSLDGVPMMRDVTSSQTAEVSNTTNTTAPTGKPKPLDGTSILLAEDGPDNQRLISMLLKRAGAEVTVAGNGQIAHDQALGAIEAGHAYDLIFMDMQMPELDGYDATGLLRNKGYTGPIIALTAHAMSSDRAKCIDAGCDDYATKPVNVKKLIGLATQYIGTTHRPAPDQDEANTPSQPQTPVGNTPAKHPTSEQFSHRPGALVPGPLESFMNQLSERVAAIGQSVSDHDLEALHNLAHQLKQDAGSHGMGQIAQAADKLSKLSTGEDALAGARRMLEHLSELAQDVRDPDPDLNTE